MARGSSASRTVIWLTLALYGLVVSGLPLPVAGLLPVAGSPAAERLAGKDRSRPFPCMDKPCGCATAEQCFSNCCCNSPAELLAWAEAHRLDPATLLALQHRVTATAPTAPSETCCCSSATAAPSCCAPTECGPADECCAANPLASPEDRDPAPTSSKVISLKAMLACGGILAGWSTAMTSLPPPAAVRCDPCMRLVGMLSITDEIGHSADPLSDAPPPRS